MPELPEVEFARRWLDARLTGRTLIGLELLDPAVVRVGLSTSTADAHPDPATALRPLLGKRVVALERWGKRLGITLEDRGLLVHLGMTGRFVEHPSPPRHARLGIAVRESPPIWFDDPRRFGCVTPASLPLPLRDGLGPDPWIEPIDGLTLSARLPGRRAIKVALLDQGRLAGIGNIQATEALWRSGIHPARRCLDLDPAAWDRLATGIRGTLRDTLSDMGEGEAVYISKDRSRNPFAIYRRAGEPCPRCGAPIASSRLGGRATTWCEACQPLSQPGLSPDSA